MKPSVHAALALLSLGAVLPAHGSSPAVAVDGPLGDQSFEYLVGSWSCQGHFEPSGRTTAATIEFHRDAGTDTLAKSHVDAAPGQYQAVERWGYVPGLKIFRASVSDRSSGMRWYTSTGWSGPTLAWQRSRSPGETNG